MSKSTAEAGRLVLVVGPSGVGKDTLLDGARAALADDPVVFARREITRPEDAGGERHRSVDWETFRRRRDAGGYLLAWEANGHGYGLPVDLAEALAAGKTVVANGSRAAVHEARGRFPRLRVVSILASPDVIAARLAARGREAAAEVAARYARGQALSVTGDDVVEVRNDGAPEEGVEALVAAIRG